MGAYKLSSLCEKDLAKMYEFGIERFGHSQAQKYISGLNESFESLASNSYIGTDSSELSSNLRKLTFKSHMIFYLSTDYGVLIIRVLHQSMDYNKHISE